MKSCHDSSTLAISETRFSSITLNSNIEGLGFNINYRILEIGSGNGNFLEFLNEKGFKDIRGIDIRPRHKDKSLLVDTGNLEHLPYDNNSFDAVISHMVFDDYLYGSDVGKILTNIHRVLAPNGTYFGTEPIENKKVISVTKLIQPRANSIISGLDGTIFIPAQNKS